MFSSRKTGSASNAYNLTKSLRFRSSASAYLNRTISTDGSLRKGTFSFWIKRANNRTDGEPDNIYQSASTGDNIYRAIVDMGTNGGTPSLRFFSYDSSGSLVLYLVTSALYRDPSAWYHIVCAFDTTQATSSNRAKIYVNGVEQTAFSSSTYPSQNTDLGFFKNLTSGTYIGANRGGSAGTGAVPFASCYLAEYNVIDGQQLAATSFGSTNALTGVWQPAKYTGTYGTNGFYLKFTDTTSTATLGTDYSGNSNTWTTNNFNLTAGSTYDSMTDVPTLTSATTANYAVANPLMNLGGIVNVTNGNLTATKSGNGDYIIPSTMAIPAGTGKWYWEVTATTISASSNFSLGVVNSTITTGAWGTSSPSAVFWNASGGSRQAYNVPSTGTSWSVASGDVIGQALDATTGNFSLYKNGTLVETWNASVNTALSSFAFASSYANGESYSYNFGQQGFTYTPPTGFVALNTYNLPTSTIVKGNTVMDATLYTGNGSTQTITNAAPFKPDLVWIKNRSNAFSHCITDSVRGTNLQLASNSTGADQSTTDGLTAFNSNGFSLGAGTQQYSSNTNSQTYVGWQWQAGQGTTSSNTSGSITSTVSVNASAGFSVVTYTGNGTGGATIGHGLGVAPKMIIVKNRGSVTSWLVYHSSVGATAWLELNATDASQSNAGAWNNTAPTSSVFSVGNFGSVNESAKNLVAYCWSEVAGFSKFGSYAGNSSSDGPFIYTGFRPKYILIKNISNGTTDWYIFDTTRSTYNVANTVLNANLSSAELTGGDIDILSNGFKPRASTTATNKTGDTYIYACYAENPFKNALAR
jgi:hypothetical protein